MNGSDNVWDTVDTTRSIAVLHLPHHLKKPLQDAGYKTISDLVQVSAEDLSTELSIERKVAEDILQAALTPTPVSGPSNTSQSRIVPSQDIPSHAPKYPTFAASSFLHAAELRRFSTFSKAIDALIGSVAPASTKSSTGLEMGTSLQGARGNIRPGVILEITGPPGSGKSAIAIALALSCRLGSQSSLESREGQPNHETGDVLVVDTEGAITPDRLKQVAESLTKSSEESPLQVLKGIHILRIATQSQMIALITILDEWLEEHPQVTLVIIDTLSFHFRQPTLDMRTRFRMMELLKQQIGKAVTVRGCAVVITNQLATKLLTAENKPANFDTGDRAVLMPQLGDSWIAGNTIRLVLFRGQGDETRFAHASALGCPRGVPWAQYDIDLDGLPCDFSEKDIN